MTDRVTGTTGTGSVPPCPRCRAAGMQPSEAVQKLEGILAKDKFAEEELENHLNFDETIEHLSEPEKPKLFSFRVWIILICIPVINILSIFVSPLNRGLKIFMSIIALIFIGCIVWAVNSNKYVDPVPHNVTMAAGLTLFVLYGICLTYSWFYERAQIRRTLLPEYEKIRARWLHLWYCEPCKIVYFDDQSGKSAPVARTRQLLLNP